MDATAKLTSFVVFILIGSTVFTLVFRGVDGDLWVERLLTALPGGALGFLIVVNLMIFLLAFFLDFVEIAFILVPLLAPVALKLGIGLVWFGVLLGINMQTSFMHPPFSAFLSAQRRAGLSSNSRRLLGRDPLRPHSTHHGRAGDRLSRDGDELHLPIVSLGLA